jgi:hypothetical protein
MPYRGPRRWPARRGLAEGYSSSRRPPRRSRRQIGENDSGGALDAHGPSVGRMASPVHPLRSSSIMRCDAPNLTLIYAILGNQLE